MLKILDKNKNIKFILNDEDQEPELVISSKKKQIKKDDKEESEPEDKEGEEDAG